MNFILKLLYVWDHCTELKLIHKGIKMNQVYFCSFLKICDIYTQILTKCKGKRIISWEETAVGCWLVIETRYLLKRV
jgi:hypothetical protein